MKRSKFLDHIREVIRKNHLSYSTEKTYIGWIYRYIVFHNQRHPEEMGRKEWMVRGVEMDRPLQFQFHISGQQTRQKSQQSGSHATDHYRKIVGPFTETISRVS